MTKEHVAGLVGEFTWDFSQQFFIETAEGNFVWSDPDYQGDGSIRKYAGSFQDWIKADQGGFGRSKGTHIIGSYCGDFIFVEED
jgi:hypothetical protein